jgi:hypothetical protein
MIDKDVMVLQNRTNSAMEQRDPCGEPNPTAGDASHTIYIKVEVSDTEEEVGPVPITFPEIKAEPEVRCMSLYVHCTRPWRSVGCEMLRISYCLEQCCPTFLCTRAQFTDAYGGAGATTLLLLLPPPPPCTMLQGNFVKVFNRTQTFKNVFLS